MLNRLIKKRVALSVAGGLRRWPFILYLACGLGPLIGQTISNGILRGTVIDTETDQPLYGVNLALKGTVLGTASDQEGCFTILRLPEGVYTLEVTMIGYKRQSIDSIRITAGAIITLDIRMEPTVLEQPTLVVTASKRKQPIEYAPTSVDVLRTPEIRSRSIVTLDELLQNTAGIGINRGQIDMRGSTGFNWSAGSRVLLMVDGHPLISGDTGGINWDAIPVDEVESIEVVKGAGSALYGSNAMAGMVNIITRDPTPHPETRYKLHWGFYDEPAYSNWRWTDRFYTYRIRELGDLNPLHTLSFEGVDLTHSRQLGRVGILVTVGRKRSRGYHQNGNYSRWNAMGKMKVNLSPDKSLTVVANWAINNRDDFIQWVSQDHALEVPAEAIGDKVRSEKANVHATFRHGVSRKLAYTLKANVYRYNWRNRLHDNKDYAVTDRLGFEAQGDYVSGKHSVTFGSEMTAHDVSSLIYGDHNTWDLAFYGEDQVILSPKWTLTMGSRFDFHQVAGISSDRQVSPRAGLVWRPAEGTSLRLSAGHGFRAPSIAEVFANIRVSGFTVVPNLDLKEAERAWSAELGIRQVISMSDGNDISNTAFSKNPMRWLIENATPGLIVDGALFWSHYRNMIDVDINPDLMAFQFINVGRARNHGIEIRLTGSFFHQRLTTTTGYTYIDPEEIATGQMLTYRSRHRFNTGLSFKIWRLTLGWDLRYASRVETVVNVYSSDQRVPMHVMDGRIIYHAGRFDITLEAKNLRNYHYTLRQRLIEPIRHIVLTVRGIIS